MEIDLALNNEVEDFKEDYESIYLEIIKEACKQLDIHDDLELSVIFVDDQRIHEINKEYRKIDRSTDVISFALEDSEQYYIEGMPREIGDIFISNASRRIWSFILSRNVFFIYTWFITFTWI